MLHRRSRQNGFTLIELMISIGLLTILLTLISQLFGQTSEAVSTSVRSSALMAGARSVGTQMDADFKNMLGPKGDIADPTGGYIVIINHRIPNVAFPFSRNGAEYEQDFIRSDQIVFVRNGVGVRSMTPINANRYGSTLAAENTPVIVRYGHALRTNRNGSRVAGAGTGLGQANAGLDRVATEWILGRSQLLMNPPGLDVTAGTGHTFANSALVNSTSSIFAGTTNSSYPYGTAFTRLGLSDVTLQPYAGPAGPTISSLRSQLSTPIPATRNRNYLWTSYAFNRMQVNPAPTGTNYESWAIAQTHGILQPNCSEFIVQFAADLNGNGRVDTTDPSGNDVGGAIRWYDAFNTNFDGTGTAPVVQWQQPAPVDGTPADTNYPYQPYTAPGEINGGLPANATNVFIFRDRDATPRTTPVPAAGASVAEPSSNWPYMIRIRYRLHDARGKVTSNDPWALTDGLDNDGDGVIDNPGEDQISGRWFEQIYRVPRPGVAP